MENRSPSTSPLLEVDIIIRELKLSLGDREVFGKHDTKSPSYVWADKQLFTRTIYCRPEERALTAVELVMRELQCSEEFARGWIEAINPYKNLPA